jgi:hypothetical protein
MTAILLLIASIAHASGTSIGNGRVACREGARDTLLENQGQEGTSSYYVTYTCTRGQWINLAALPVVRAAKPATCREGQEEYFPVGGDSYNGETDHFICHNGRFVPNSPRR